MNKHWYVLVAPGRKTKVTFFGKEYNVDWRSLYFSRPKSIIAPDRKVAEYEIRQKLTETKWQAFAMMEDLMKQKEPSEAQIKLEKHMEKYNQPMERSINILSNKYAYIMQARLRGLMK